MGLNFLRAPGGSKAAPIADKPERGDKEVTTTSQGRRRIEIPFKPVDLCFRDIGYEVTASTTKDTLKLLKSISGVFRCGRMCALMGSSGAG